jgi:hypothetical protein
VLIAPIVVVVRIRLTTSPDRSTRSTQASPPPTAGQGEERGGDEDRVVGEGPPRGADGADAADIFVANDPISHRI